MGVIETFDSTKSQIQVNSGKKWLGSYIIIKPQIKLRYSIFLKKN